MANGLLSQNKFELHGNKKNFCIMKMQQTRVQFRIEKPASETTIYFVDDLYFSRKVNRQN